MDNTDPPAATTPRDLLASAGFDVARATEAASCGFIDDVTRQVILKNAPAARALAVLVAAVPLVGDLGASKGLKLVREIIKEFNRSQGRHGGARSGTRRKGSTAEKQVRWEELVAQGHSTTLANNIVARLFNVRPAQVRRLRDQARKEGKPWIGDDKDRKRA